MRCGQTSTLQSLAPSNFAADGRIGRSVARKIHIVNELPVVVFAELLLLIYHWASFSIKTANSSNVTFPSANSPVLSKNLMNLASASLTPMLS